MAHSTAALITIYEHVDMKWIHNITLQNEKKKCSKALSSHAFVPFSSALFHSHLIDLWYTLHIMQWEQICRVTVAEEEPVKTNEKKNVVEITSYHRLTWSLKFIFDSVRWKYDLIFAVINNVLVHYFTWKICSTWIFRLFLILSRILHFGFFCINGISICVPIISDTVFTEPLRLAKKD